MTNQPSNLRLRRQIAIPLGIGIVLGIVLGAAFDNIALGLVLGIVVGGIGAAWRKNRGQRL